MKLLTIVGARPQFVKAAALTMRARARASSRIDDVVVHTGQHYDYEMSRAFFDELSLPEPKHNLGVGSAGHGAQTGRMLECLEPIIEAERPDAVLVYGDTNSTLAGAVVAAKLHVPVAHIEAGLRSFNRRMPEEINRVLADHVSSWLFCPTETAVRNLAREGITEGVHLVGDVMYEMLIEHSRRASIPAALSQLRLPPKSYVLATVHRAENTDDPARLASIFRALARISHDLPVVCPLHPRTTAALNRLKIELPSRLHTLPPFGYSGMLAAERDATAILTDSGGVQKEAYWLGVPCITLRDETEWTETISDGRNVLAGADEEAIVRFFQAIRDRRVEGVPSVSPANAADAILDTLEATILSPVV